MISAVSGPEQHVRDVIVAFFWRCFPLEPEERAARGLHDDGDVLRVAPADLGDGAQFADALHAAFVLSDDVDLRNATVGEVIERVLVHWDRASFDPEALGYFAPDELSAGDDVADDDGDEEGSANGDE
jgi:hypothetical protein